MVASALWVALPSVGAGDDGFIASSFPLQSQQEEIGNKILLHLEKALLISTHLPYPLLSAPKIELNRAKVVCAERGEASGPGGLDGVPRSPQSCPWEARAE